jgi:hypothetical protein
VIVVTNLNLASAPRKGKTPLAIFSPELIASLPVFA